MTNDEPERAAEPTEPTATETQSTEAEPTEARSTEAQSTEAQSTEAEPTEARPRKKWRDYGSVAAERFRNLGRWLDRRSDGIARWSGLTTDMLVFGVCMTVVVFYRLLTLEQIEVGGDALKVWEFARHLAYGGEFPEKLNHHTARFGLTIPTYVTQKLWGSGATTYYLGPLIASSILHAFVFLIARRFAGVVAGVVAIVLLLQFEPMERASSQILPETFGPMYVAVAYYFAFVFTDAKNKWARYVSLGLSGAAMFMAYGSKMSYLYFAPGLALVVWRGLKADPDDFAATDGQPGDARWYRRAWWWLRRRKLVVPGALALLVLGFIAIESIFLSAKTGASSHFSILSGSHGSVGEKGRIRSVEDFFALYTQAPTDWTEALLVGAVATLGVLAFAEDKRARLYAAALVIFVLLQTFVVRRLNPLTPWTQPHPRYLIAMAAPLAIVVAVFVVSALGRIFATKEGRSPRFWERTARGSARLIMAFTVLFAFQHDLPERWEKEWGKRDGWHETEELARELSRAFEEGLPIVSTSYGGKPVLAAGIVYIDAGLLMKNGKVATSSSFTRKFQRGKYLARAVAQPNIKKKRLDAWVKDRVKRRECAVTLRQSARFMSVQTYRRKKCVSLGEAVEKPVDKRSRAMGGGKGRGRDRHLGRP